MIQIYTQISRGMKNKCDHKNKRVFNNIYYTNQCGIIIMIILFVFVLWLWFWYYFIKSGLQNST